MNIILIAGGWSTERNVSLSGAKNIHQTLSDMGHQVTLFDLSEGFNKLLLVASRHDFAFINLHGAPGEDGLVQALLEKAGCPYQGSGPAPSMLALDKAASKQLFRFNNLPTADWEFLVDAPASDWRPGLPYPLFVKSNTGGSSLDLGRADNRQELDKICQPIFAAHRQALLEPAIQGRDVTCAILGHEALPPILIEPLAGDYFDYTSKYAKGGARETCPAPLPGDVLLNIQKLALQAYEVLGLQGYGRIDFILSNNNELFILEANTLPGMTPTSLLPQAAAAVGMDFPELLRQLIDLGMTDHAKK